MFGMLEITYLFLGGTGAALSLVSSTLGLLSPRDFLMEGGIRAVASEYRRLLAPPLLVAFALVGIGALCLLSALGNPGQAMGLFFSSCSTWANVGAWSLLLCAFSALGQAGLVGACSCLSVRMLRVVQIGTTVVSAATMLYTGLLLYGMDGIPFWHSPWLVALFFLSALSCGLGAFLLVSTLCEASVPFVSTIRRAMRIDSAVVCVEGVMLAFLVLTQLASANSTAVSSAAELVAGDLASLFWGLLVIVGLVVPFLLECTLPFVVDGFSDRTRTIVLILLGAALLVGGFVLRYVIVSVGAHPFLGVGIAQGV